MDISSLINMGILKLNLNQLIGVISGGTGDKDYKY
jgi:hypothetical protein